MIPASVQIQWPTQQAINLVETSYSSLMLIDAPPTILPCPHSSSPSCISAALANKCMRKERMVGFPAHYPTFMFLLILSFTAQAAGQPAPAPAPSPPPNITAVLEKGGQFQMLIRLLKTTQIDERINSQLNNSNAGLTLFAPSDAAFSSLSPGTLNGLSREQQTTLLQFHVIPTLITISEFQTVRNPL
ncbi:hypothetical protein HPP92_017503 [Vanilla planifolia]|uniref:FAS1 domain-containing protein n=1 Tax=Vanilla planifolia TaxID=51239 RepID=A0A835Q865_VANPL|nr:hypothetical protein HPP92_018108 [Vanilla planifolia]KAG0468175.1 hypothetical protein HPP92_017503 [Vanilla planifolia]